MAYPSLLFAPEITLAVQMRETASGLEIWDPVRKKWLVGVPEEWVRQHCISYLDALGYATSNMSTEAARSALGLRFFFPCTTIVLERSLL